MAFSTFVLARYCTMICMLVALMFTTCGRARPLSTNLNGTTRIQSGCVVYELPQPYIPPDEGPGVKVSFRQTKSTPPTLAVEIHNRLPDPITFLNTSSPLPLRWDRIEIFPHHTSQRIVQGFERVPIAIPASKIPKTRQDAIESNLLFELGSNQTIVGEVIIENPEWAVEEARSGKPTKQEVKDKWYQALGEKASVNIYWFWPGFWTEDKERVMQRYLYKSEDRPPTPIEIALLEKHGHNWEWINITLAKAV